MRWKIPKAGEWRNKTMFAFRPIKVESGEVRWLELVTVSQWYGGLKRRWHNIEFLDKKIT